jgi:hypothetical protein
MAGPDDKRGAHILGEPVTHNGGGAVTRNATSKTRAKNARFDARERHLSLEKTRGPEGGS